MEELKKTWQEWTNFVGLREAERAKRMNREDTAPLREKIRDKEAELLRVKAELSILKAELVLHGGGAQQYQKATFDAEWAERKHEMKADVERLIAQELQSGKSIPRLMKDLNSKNSSLFYQIKDSMTHYRGADKEDVAQTPWDWSDATSVHRYALGYAPGSSEYAYVLLKGALDTEFEGEQCIFDYNTGYFISGNRNLFDSVTESTRKQRSQLLAKVLSGEYASKVKRDNNPYFS